MIARELPSDQVLASWQHVEQRALDLRAAGMPGSLRELRVRAYLDLLQERDSRDQPAAAARHPGTRWCITALNPDGTAAAHACLPGWHPRQVRRHPAPRPP
jgi:hypothetical protein